MTANFIIGALLAVYILWLLFYIFKGYKNDNRNNNR